MKNALRIFSLLLVVMMFSSVAYAASPWTEQSTYADKVVHKLDFGIKNLFGGWTEIFTAPMRAKDAGKNCMSGVGEGLMNAIVYTVGGALHTATFPLPIDVPLPNNGVSFD